MVHAILSCGTNRNKIFFLGALTKLDRLEALCSSTGSSALWPPLTLASILRKTQPSPYHNHHHRNYWRGWSSKFWNFISIALWSSFWVPCLLLELKVLFFILHVGLESGSLDTNEKNQRLEAFWGVLYVVDCSCFVWSSLWTSEFPFLHFTQFLRFEY